MNIDLTRFDLFNEIKESLRLDHEQFSEKCIDFIKKRLLDQLEIIENIDVIREKIRIFQLRVQEKYKKHCRVVERFLEKESSWLKGKVFNDFELSKETYLPNNFTPFKRLNRGNNLFEILDFFFFKLFEKVVLNYHMNQNQKDQKKERLAFWQIQTRIQSFFEH